MSLLIYFHIALHFNRNGGNVLFLFFCVTANASPWLLIKNSPTHINVEEGQMFLQP